MLDIDGYLLKYFDSVIYVRNKTSSVQSSSIVIESDILALCKIEKRQGQNRILCISGSRQLQIISVSLKGELKIEAESMTADEIIKVEQSNATYNESNILLLTKSEHG